MSDIYEYDFKSKKMDNAVCRVAYTLNNEQPVKSTIIGDQPLFYWDYEIEDEEEAYLDEADLSILESEIENLKQEIETFDRFSANFAEDPEQCFEDFLENADSITSFRGDDTDEAQAETGLRHALNESRLAQCYLHFAEDHGVKITMSRHVPDGEYDRKSGNIFINPSLEHADLVLVAARELRRHWQHRQGALINPLLFHPDNAVLINRLQIADLSTAMVRVAWELQLAGHKAAWERVENSSMADLGRAFAREAFLDFRTLNNGQANAAVFETWFLSERCRLEDKTLIKQMLADYQGYVFDLEEAETNITPTLISALGEMPYGKNYLSQHAGTLMTDPIFTDVRDRSNANFLWFIKFERSFREAEQELQTHPEASAQDDRLTGSHNNKNQDHPYAEATKLPSENEQYESTGNADVVTLYTKPEDEAAQGNGNADKALLAPKGKNKRNKKAGDKGHQGDSTNIVYLRWSGEQ